eukprot:1332281-Alexandrium_andersonii.AAC.1
MAMPVRTQNIYTTQTRGVPHAPAGMCTLLRKCARACPGTRSALYTARCLPGVLYTCALHS